MSDRENAWLTRYSRQILFPPLGEVGQRILQQSSILLVGCGGLGTAIANHLVRAGVGHLRIVDADVIQIHNLHRQSLYDESDVVKAQPKVLVAARKLQAINAGVDIEAQTIRMDHRNILSLMEGVSLVLDGTDNFESRYIINDACVYRSIPWIYGGVVGSIGMTMNILPSESPCLRCLFVDPPEQTMTADTHGIVNSLPAIIASIQVTEAIKILVGSPAVSRHLLHLDIWHNEYRPLEIHRADNCRCCGLQRYDFLKRKA